MTNLSVVIITKNEAHNIERCITSCLPLDAQIIVLDSHSTDNTEQLAKNLGAQVHKVDWKGYGATKNEGAHLAKNNWILSLDADEALDENLQKNIIQTLKEEKDLAGCWLYRSFIFNDKQLLYGALKNEKRLRLYNKIKMQWNLDSVHEDLEPIDKSIDWPTATLQGSLLHYSYKNIEDMRERLDKYAQLSAEKLHQKSTFYLSLKKIVAPSFSFLKNYFFRLGILDGKEGFIFAKEQANYVRKKYAYAIRN
jgi:glycosyltransferase involved in cell wall biosynthesis